VIEKQVSPPMGTTPHSMYVFSTQLYNSESDEKGIFLLSGYSIVATRHMY